MTFVRVASQFYFLSTVYVVSAHGGRLTKIVRTYDAADDLGPVSWSADGRRLAYTTCDINGYYCRYATASSRGGHRRILGPSPGVGRPVWSPTTKHLLVIASEANGYRLRVIGEDGRGRTLVSGPTCCSEPLWSPNGKRIAFYGLTEDTPQGDSILEVIGLDQRSADPVVKIDVELPPFSWASDNRRIAFIQSTDDVIYDGIQNGHEFRKFASNLEIANLDQRTQLLDDGPVDDEYPAWQPQPKA